MSDPDAYIALIASLPSSERLFASKQPPLSRLRLERRLSAMSVEDRALLASIEHVMSWRSYAMEATAADAQARAKTVLATTDSETLRAIVMERMDLRTVIAALRRRERGDGAPSGVWSASRLAGHILSHWSDPTFKLDNRMPWLRGALELMTKKDPLGLERYLLEITLRQLQRHAGRHLFDVEAVIIYVLKWNISDRWARADARAATGRFETLVHQALGRFPELSVENV